MRWPDDALAMIDDALAPYAQTLSFDRRALFERFNIELLATTEGPTDTLEHHAKIKASDWKGRVVTAYRMNREERERYGIA